MRGGTKRRAGQGEDQGRRKDNDPLLNFGESGGFAGGTWMDEGEFSNEEAKEQAGHRLNEERKSRVMQVGAHGLSWEKPSAVRSRLETFSVCFERMFRCGLLVKQTPGPRFGDLECVYTFI